MIFHIDSCQGVIQKVACLFLLLWSCLIAHVLGVIELMYHVASCFSIEFLQGYEEIAHTCFKLETASVASGQKDEERCFCLLSFPAHGSSWDGRFWFGVCFRGLPGLFCLDLFCKWRSCRAHDKGSCEILQLFLTRFRAFFLVMHPFCFLTNALLTCVHLKFSCRTSRVSLEPDCWRYDLLYFPSNQETKTEKVLYPRCVQKFEYDVGQCCFWCERLEERHALVFFLSPHGMGWGGVGLCSRSFNLHTLVMHTP